MMRVMLITEITINLIEYTSKIKPKRRRRRDLKLQMKIKELEVERNAIYEDYQDLGKEKYLLEEKLESRGFDPIIFTLSIVLVVSNSYSPSERCILQFPLILSVVRNL